MRNFVKNRIIPIVLVVTVMVTMLVPFASAAFPAGFEDTGERDRWTGLFNSGSATSVYANRLLERYTGGSLLVSDFLWLVMDRQLGRPAGDIQKSRLYSFCDQLNSIFRDDICASTFWSDFKDIFLDDPDEQFKKEHNAFTAFGLKSPKFEVMRHESQGFWRIKDTVNGIWVTNSRGEYPYSDPSDSADGDKWVGERSCSNQVTSGQVIILDDHVLRSMQSMLVTEGTPCIVRSLGNYNAIWYNQQYYCDSQGRPYVAQKNPDNFAVNQERPAVDTEPEESPTIDIPSMIVMTPDNGLLFIDEIIYDEGTKSYYFDSHDTYDIDNNYYVTYNYSWTYHINYTSITYIGQTEEYNKYYEVYYELPDGRSSADLTREELEQLNVSIDVIPYGRSADDTSLRSLYHFDGDTRDASYWNYCTDFTWNKGASLTYMDASVFNGALYLDEQEHDFTLTLPSNITSADFTLQFRYYQSYTAAPQTDSYIKLGDSTVFQFNGSQFFSGSGTALVNTPIGSWNEIALIRHSGTLYYYLNGVCIGNVTNTTGFSNLITFHFGSSQQTYKYFDELRVLNYALQNVGANYTPTSVPFDTNLALVLPTDSVPIADEYWSITSSASNRFNYNISSGVSCSFQFANSVDKGSDLVLPNQNDTSDSLQFPRWGYISGKTTPNFYDGYMSLTTSSNALWYQTGSASKYLYSSWYGNGLSTMLWREGMSNSPSKQYLSNGNYVLSVVLDDGTVDSFPFTVSFGTRASSSKSFSWGSIGVTAVATLLNYGSPSYTQCYLYIMPKAGTSVNFRHIELISGTETDLSAEFVQSVTPMTPDQLNTPTLAVRTDIDITSYQIGGVRPSLPEKGQVWAMVESGYITSIQIYNGSAWEGCDGRIWTGQRWIPARSYNVITLQDMYDVADSTPNYEYIYSESGFWSWWQKSWNSFVERFFASGGGSGGNVDIDADIVVGNPDEEDDQSLWQFLSLVVSGGKSLVGGVRHLFSGVVSLVPDSVESITGAFDSGGVAVGVMDGSASDPDAGEMPATFGMTDESEVLDPWRYR